MQNVNYRSYNKQKISYAFSFNAGSLATDNFLNLIDLKTIIK